MNSLGSTSSSDSYTSAFLLASWSSLGFGSSSSAYLTWWLT